MDEFFERMSSTEFHTWMALYQLEKEDRDVEIAKAKEEAENT